jgi:hypothetical protein
MENIHNVSRQWTLNQTMVSKLGRNIDVNIDENYFRDTKKYEYICPLG